MTAGTFPDAWEEVALVTIQKLGGTAYQFAAITDTIELPEGDYPGESIPNLAGGRIWKQSPQEDGEFTLDLYPLNLDTTAGEGLFQEFNGGTYVVSQPFKTDVDWKASINRSRDKFMVAVMWTDDSSQVSAVAATTTASAVALRFHAKECRIVSHKASFTDGILKVTVNFKYPAMNKAGDTKTCQWDSTDDGSGTALTALTYTASL